MSPGGEKIRGGRPLGEMCQHGGNEGALTLKTNVIAGVCLTCGSLDGFIASTWAKDQGKSVRNKVSQLDLKKPGGFYQHPPLTFTDINLGQMEKFPVRRVISE